MTSDVSSSKYSFNNRSLWQLINGTGVLKPTELVARDLKKHSAKLLEGLLFYKKPVTIAGEQLKNKKLSKTHKDFLQRLSSFLALDELQAYELFQAFLVNDFRGSQKNLQDILNNERHTQALVYKIRDFYYTERLYLLQCLKVIINFWQNEVHPYKNEFEEFMNELTADKDIQYVLQKMLDQLSATLKAPLPNWQTHGTMMTEKQSLIWARQNMKEQCELLEGVVIYMKDFEVNVDRILTLLEMFKSHGFGKHQIYKHILELSDPLNKRIGYLEMLIVLESFDLESVYLGVQKQSFEDHFILKSSDHFQKVDKIMQTLGSDPCHGPVLLCWAGVRMMYPGGEDSTITRKMGNKAIQLHVFDVLLDTLNTEPFNETTSFVSAVAMYIIYTLLVNTLTAFDESTLGQNRDIKVLRTVISHLLKQEFASEDFWQKGLGEGVGSVYHSSLCTFPMDFNSLLELSTALASSSTESAEKVLDVWKQLPRYTENLDKNASQDLVATKDPNAFKLAHNKMPYPGGDFKIDIGTIGQIISTGRRDEIPVIQWDVQFNGWEMLLCEMECLLKQVSYGAGKVSIQQISRVNVCIELVSAVMKSCPKSITQFPDITDCIYQIVHRFARFSPCQGELMAACMKCLTCVAKENPTQVWHNMKQTGLLPYLTENVDNLAEVLSGQGLSAGSYGALLVGYECNSGEFPVTMAMLDFLSVFIQPFFKQEKEAELMAPILYLLREVFPNFQKWRYNNPTKREGIGQSCLGIFHKVLTFLTVKKKVNNRPHLQEVCVYSLLFTESGRSLLELIATGADTIEMALAQQGSIVEKGIGAEMIQLIQLSFSVLNRLLLLKSPDLPASPVENALSSQPAGRQTQHIVATIAGYIYHRHNPRLPSLACLLLKRLAMVPRMSILACLGGESETIRDMYLTRLQAITEDIRLKVVILEFLSVCVDAQPGLIEIFLNVQSSSDLSLSSSSASKKDLSMGKTSCLQTVLDLMEAKKQGDYMCPPDLLCACIGLMSALWEGLRDTAMSVLRARENYWLSMCAPLTRDLPPVDEAGDLEVSLPYQIKTIAHSLRILSSEIYTVTSAKLDSKLKKVLSDVSAANRWTYWSKYIKDCLVSESKKSETVTSAAEMVENPTLLLVVAWKNFIITTAKQSVCVSELQFTDTVKDTIIQDLMDSITALVGGNYTAMNVKLTQIVSALLFTMVKIWTSSVRNTTKLVVQLQRAVSQTLSNSKTLIPPIQIGLLGAITVICQHNRQTKAIALETKMASIVLPTICELLLQSTRQLPSPQEVAKKDNSSETSSSDIKLKLQMTTCCLLEEIILQSQDHVQWLPYLQSNFILPTLLSSMEVFIKAKQGLQYVQTGFLLLLTVGKHEKGSEALVMSGLTQHTCLAMLPLYADSDFFNKNKITMNNSKGTVRVHKATWCGVYCHCIELYACVLGTLKYSFLEDALHFVGAHQDRMQQCLEMCRISLSTSALEEAEKTCDFIHRLSHYLRQWRLNLADSLVKLQTSLIYMSQSFVAFLMRPRYLQQIIEQNNIQKSNLSSAAKQPRLQQQSSLEDIDTPSSQLVHTQLRLLHILASSMASLRQFTPDLLEVLHDQSIDFSEYNPFLTMGFSAPSVDQDSSPSFGTLTSCVRDVCVRLLTKIDPKLSSTSPHKSSSNTDISNIGQIIPKSLVLFVMENTLYIIMSQATRYLRDPYLPTTDKQLLKRELGTEMNYFLMELQRYIRRGTPSSPSSSSSQTSTSPKSTAGASSSGIHRSISQSAFTAGQDMEFFKFVQEFVVQVLKQ